MLDASVTLAWGFEDEGGAYVDAVLETLRAGEAIVASHWGLEVVNGLLVAERRRRIAADEAVRFARFLLALPIAVDPVARGRAFETVLRLGRLHQLTAYDAAYLELAIRHGIPLATLDRTLRVAADAEGVGVAAGPPS